MQKPILVEIDEVLAVAVRVAKGDFSITRRPMTSEQLVRFEQEKAQREVERAALKARQKLEAERLDRRQWIPAGEPVDLDLFMKEVSK